MRPSALLLLFALSACGGETVSDIGLRTLENLPRAWCQQASNCTDHDQPRAPHEDDPMVGP